VSAAIMQLVQEIGFIIRDHGPIPSGHLYNMVQHIMSLQTYEILISRLEQAGLVTRKHHLLTWTGPKAGAESRNG